MGKFYVEKQSDGTYAIKTYLNNYYVQADINDTTSGILHACGTSVGTWEKFALEASNTSAIPGNSQPEETTTQPTVETTTTQPVTETTTEAVKKPQTEGKLISKNKAVTVSGNENDTFTGKNIVDGDDGTRWSSDFADNAWVCIDLGKTYEINNVVLKWEAAYATEYRIEISNDGMSWTTAKT